MDRRTSDARYNVFRYCLRFTGIRRYFNAGNIFSEDITETEPADRTDRKQVSEHNKILIAYFTWAENAADTSGS